MTELVSFLPLVAIALLFWLMVVRPASRRQKDLARLQSALQPGPRADAVLGHLRLRAVLVDDRVRVEIAPGVEVEVVRARHRLGRRTRRRGRGRRPAAHHARQEA